MTRWRSEMARWPGALVALLSGALYPLAFAPLAWRPLLFVAFAGLLVSGRDVSPRQAFLRGWLWGLGAFGVGVSWVYNSMHDFGGAAPVAASAFTALFVVYLALFPGLTLSLWRSAVRRVDCPWYSALLVALLWAASEWLRGWLMTGFPWLPTGAALLDTPFAGAIPVGGGLGAGALAMLFVALLLFGRWSQRLAALALAAICWGLSAVSWGEPDEHALEVALVQGNIPQELKLQRRYLNLSLQTYRELSAEYIGRSDLVIWPETAVPTYDRAVERFLRQVQRDLEGSGTSLMTGVFQRAENGRDYYNAMLEVGGPAYRKHQLVPFGEYMPLRWAMDVFSAFVDIPMSDMASGPLMREPMTLAGVPVGVSICYEMVYPDVLRGPLPEARLLINASNDAWFGDSFAPHQHLEMARLRALELSRPVARSTNTGITAAIDARGEVVATIASFEAGVLTTSLRPHSGSTPFMRLGQWYLGWLIVVAAVAFMWKAKRSR
ncbi:MAG: apolipoprotein N-acyltransferase [Pseudomonadota bacterium]